MPNEKRSTDHAPAFLIVTGLSGSGLTSATNAFEDLGYFCVDNLPLTLVPTFARLLLPNADGETAIERAALVVNIRERHFLSEFPNELKKLRRKKLQPFVVFFEASDEVLRRRFSETRRPHPADKGIGLLEAIRTERQQMVKIRELADLIIDTSDLTVHSLRRLVIDKFSSSADEPGLKVQIVSFGHKYGAPRDLDLMFDVRHLPNPFFEKNLREFSGRDRKVVKFLDAAPEAKETLSRFADLLKYLLPFYQREGKSYLNIGIGCTGGRHRSVMIADRIKEIVENEGYRVSVEHRDMQK